MSDGIWPSVLDDFERTLDEQLAAVRCGDWEAFQGFTAPADLGPLPGAHADRARALLLRAQRLAADVGALTATTRSELSLLDRMRPTAAPASYFDGAL